MERTTPPYEPYREVAAAPFRWRLGLRPLDDGDWIEIDGGYDAEVAHKRAIMHDHPGTAFRVLDGVEPESREVLDALVDHLRRRHPERFGWCTPRPDLHPLDAAGRLVQEDLVLMVERDGRLVCGGGSVCFPNRWDLASKVGATMAEIHAPVPGLNTHLRDPIDHFLDRLRPGRGFWRLGWGVTETDELYRPVDGTAARRPAPAEPSAYVLRVERETLRRLPDTGCVLFTIRTHLTPLGRIGEGAGSLAAALEALPPDVASYKGLEGTAGYLISWLRSLPTINVQ